MVVVVSATVVGASVAVGASVVPGASDTAGAASSSSLAHAVASRASAARDAPAPRPDRCSNRLRRRVAPPLFTSVFSVFTLFPLRSLLDRYRRRFVDGNIVVGCTFNSLTAVRRTPSRATRGSDRV